MRVREILYGGLAVLTTHLSETVVRDPYIIRYQNDENSRILMLDNLASHGGYQSFNTLPKVNVKDVKF
ncbi:MAG: hypothetical protein ACI4C7_03615 [Clostridia bacterium]